MRHLVKGKTLGRKKAHRTALVRNLVTALVLHERIETTEAKAKTLKPKIERLINHAKKGSLAAKQTVLKDVFNNRVVAKKLMEVIAPKYAKRVGGYVRVVKLGKRAGDAADMAMIEFV
ncbi:MAG: 50S ribosomal protein L17 [Patescibacteria group bacterium]|nr:50S ribosomal protein L17 [Patescibacteria group bacterium]